MSARGDRPLIIVLVVAAILAPVLTGGATALFFLSRQQDDRIATLRREFADVQRANERLFGELASQTAARHAAASRAAALEAQVGDLQRRLSQTSSRLSVTARALRWQKKVNDLLQRRRTGRGSTAAYRPQPATPPTPAGFLEAVPGAADPLFALREPGEGRHAARRPS